MKYEFQVLMQRRHMKAIVGALRFRQRLLSGDVYGTLGRAAMDAWESLPDIAHGACPARRGDKGAVQLEVFKACRAIEDIVWHRKRPAQAFTASPDGVVASELLSQSATKEFSRVKRRKTPTPIRQGMPTMTVLVATRYFYAVTRLTEQTNGECC